MADNQGDGMERQSQKHIIRGAFVRLTVVNAMIQIAINTCGLIDNLFVGRTLGKDALAAMGFFSPVTVAVSLSYVIILGAQMLTGNLVGAGQMKKVNRLFISSFTVLTVLFAVFSLCCYCFRGSLAALLGAQGETYPLLCDYIRGYAPGIVPQTLTAMLMALCSFNNDIKRSYFAIGAMIVGNVLGDALLIGRAGLLGVGLASTFSSLAAFLILLPGFLKKDKLFCLSFKDGLDMSLVIEAAKRGLPSLMLTIGVITKNYCFNSALNQYTGAAGVAVAGVMATVSSLVSAIPAGCNNAYSALAGIYFGEVDRESLLDLSRIALRIGMIASGAVSLLVIHLSGTLSGLFIPDDIAVQALAHRMFILGFTFLIPNLCYNFFLQAYRAQNRMLLVNIMSFAETAVIGLFVLFTVEPFGADAAWLANTVIDVLCLVVVLVSVAVYNRRLNFSMPAMLKLAPDFGAREDEFLTFSVVTTEDVIAASQQINDFCLERRHSPQTAYHVALCVEEMATNVLRHGFMKHKPCYADIRIVSKDGELTVRLRDNCHEFDPRKRIEMLDVNHPEQNIGTRIVAGTAKQIDYYNNAGINTLIMKF
jgi:Na+-driven multidrug efflux pump/anti-sigma regulatory factor (Ser/Thr protein kinase)